MKTSPSTFVFWGAVCLGAGWLAAAYLPLKPEVHGKVIVVMAFAFLITETISRLFLSELGALEGIQGISVAGWKLITDQTEKLNRVHMLTGYICIPAKAIAAGIGAAAAATDKGQSFPTFLLAAGYGLTFTGFVVAFWLDRMTRALRNARLKIQGEQRMAAEKKEMMETCEMPAEATPTPPVQPVKKGRGPTRAAMA